MSSMFTFGNIRSGTDGQSQASQCETPARASHSLPPRMAPKRAEGERTLLIMIRNKAAWHRQKKSEAKPSGSVFPTPWGVDAAAGISHRSDKIMSFFRKVKQDKRVTLRTTKVSHYSVFTIFWLIMVSSPY